VLAGSSDGHLVGGILALRLHAFLALDPRRYAVALLTPADTLNTYAQQRLTKARWRRRRRRILPASRRPRALRMNWQDLREHRHPHRQASIFGECLLVRRAESSRWPRSVARRRTRAMAFFLTSYLLGIPVFLATLFCLLLPLAKAMTRRTGRVLLILCIVAGDDHALARAARAGAALRRRALGLSLPAMIGVAASLVSARRSAATSSRFSPAAV